MNLTDYNLSDTETIALGKTDFHPNSVMNDYVTLYHEQLSSTISSEQNNSSVAPEEPTE